MSLQDLFASVQKSCLPGIWSKGVALARDGAVSLERRSEDELMLRVRVPGRPASPKVLLWPEDEDSHCDCGEKIEPCSHIAAAIIFLKAGPASPEASPAPATGPAHARLVYRFARDASGALSLERQITGGPTGSAPQPPLRESLVARIGGVQSGRLPGPLPTVSQEDFAADRVLSQSDRAWGVLPSEALAQLLVALDGASTLELDGTLVQASRKVLGPQLELRDDGPGFRILPEAGADAPPEVFANGVALRGGTLHPWNGVDPGSDEARLFAPAGLPFARDQGPWLVSELLPRLEKRRIPVALRSTRLPVLEDALPQLVFRTEAEGPETLAVLPLLVYVNAAGETLAEVLDGRLELTHPQRVPRRDAALEKERIRELQAEFHLSPRRRRTYQGEEALRMARQLKGRTQQGQVTAAFVPEGTLQPRFRWEADGRFELAFETPSPNDTPRLADAGRVLRAWRENASAVPLLGGGFASLPSDWLVRHAESLERLLAAREAAGGQLPRAHVPELVELWEEHGQEAPDPLRRLRDGLENRGQLPEAQLPRDLDATLRPYQLEGVRWLQLLRDQGLGACLADDMGLGKTLQTLCALEGRTLIVAPTSVISAWSSQVRKFRPSLRLSVYHQAGRALDPEADVTLTTYGVLRLDQDQLRAVPWRTVVLDEAQTIRNPESQVARAAHRLEGHFRVALSGTPVENRLEDLWSIFRFLHPGFLGNLAEFREEWAAPVARGDAQRAASLRKRLRPFLLRRLKTEVARDLPPRTEVLLQAELGDAERELYRAVELSSRKDVLAALDRGDSVLGALEVLLRLRQACCHPRLLPGADAETRPSSAKTDLLLESLENSIAAGHKALVFSQWTRMLDLLEPLLRARGIGFLRIDGATPDRGRIVDEFQGSGGPPVLLLSIKAGGTGLTLTAADHVYIMDPWWNPAVEDQAADRAHRIGQENPVLIHRLVARDTVEERILALQDSKRQQARAILEGGGPVSSGLSRDELLSLLSPD